MAKDTLTVDFSKEEDAGGGRFRVPEGDYHVQILGTKKGRSENKDTPYLEVAFKILDGKRKGKKFKERLYLSPKSLKRIRLLLEAVGISVPKKKKDIPLNKLKGKKLWIELQDEEDDSGEYDPKSRIAFEGFMSEEDYEEDDEVDEDEDEDEDDDDDEDEEEEDEDDDDEDEDEDDEDDDEDEDEEEEEKPRKRRKSRAKSKAKSKSSKSKKRKKKSDDDDDEELDLDEL